MRVVTSMILLLASIQGVLGQDISVNVINEQAGGDVIMEAVDPPGWLMEDARLREDFRVEKIPAAQASTRVPSDIGDRKEFRVLNISMRQLELIEFELIVIDEAQTPRFQVWMEVAELERDGTLQDSVGVFVDLAEQRTPPGSWNPGAGFVQNIENILGEPPDVDGDGITEFLLLDIRDGWDGVTTTSYIPAFVFDEDLQAGGLGNSADIVYVDTEPGLGRAGPAVAAASAARVYAELVLVEQSPQEIPFIWNGLIRWAPVVLGFPASDSEYLKHSMQYNRGLYTYDRTFADGADRKRGELFFPLHF